MAHFAQLDQNNKVINVIVINNQDTANGPGTEEENGLAFLEHIMPNLVFKQTSYNGNFRKQYAGIGGTYIESIDSFASPQPYESWTLNETTGDWDPPIPKPEGNYEWSEETQEWVEEEELPNE